jgi:hypothetical protein
MVTKHDFFELCDSTSARVNVGSVLDGIAAIVLRFSKEARLNWKKRQSRRTMGADIDVWSEGSEEGGQGIRESVGSGFAAASRQKGGFQKETEENAKIYA